MSVWPIWHENKIFSALLALLLISLIAFVIAGAVLSVKRAGRIGVPEPYEHQITIDGVGSVIVTPDIASIILGVETKSDTVENAKTKNSASMNKIIEDIKVLGVEAKDIQTRDYSVYENTVWNPDSQVYDSQGWIVSQNIEVTVRDLSLTSKVIEVAGKNEITSIYGPNFSVEHPEKQLGPAREQAIKDSLSKIKDIAGPLGMKVKRAVGYMEWQNTGDPGMYYGKGGMMEASVESPNIETGSQEISLTVSVTYLLSE